MVKVLPQRFNPDLLARDGTRFELVIPQSAMPRLTELVLDTGHDIQVSANFSRRKDHIVVRGGLQTVFSLQCQRCLEPMEHEINVNYELVFVDSQAAADALPRELDPVIVDDAGQIHVVDLYEDEVLLHIPSFPRHADLALCQIGKTEFGELPADVEQDAQSPFKALKDIQLH